MQIYKIIFLILFFRETSLCMSRKNRKVKKNPRIEITKTFVEEELVRLSFIQAYLERTLLVKNQKLLFFNYEDFTEIYEIKFKKIKPMINNIFCAEEFKKYPELLTIQEITKLAETKNTIERTCKLAIYLKNLSTHQKVELQCYRIYCYFLMKDIHYQKNDNEDDNNKNYNIGINRLLYQEALQTSLSLFEKALLLNTGDKPLTFNNYIKNIIYTGKL